MEFSIGLQFSREFTIQEILLLRNNINNKVNAHFKDKNYGFDFEEIYVSIICVSKEFEPLFMPRPLKILKKRFAIEFEIKVDFITFFTANFEDRDEMLINKFQQETLRIFNDSNVINFGTTAFINDLNNLI
jgi:hypothetical protein